MTMINVLLHNRDIGGCYGFKLVFEYLKFMVKSGHAISLILFGPEEYSMEFVCYGNERLHPATLWF